MEKKQYKATTYPEIKTEMEKHEVDWDHGDNPILHLSADEQLMRLGVNIPAGETTRVKAVIPKTNRNSGTAQEAIDWREYEGENWITDIQDQGNCGSCVAFGTVAVLEAQARYHYSKPKRNINLSEADLFFCGAGRKCGQGWWPTKALEFVRDKKIGEENYFPYKDHDMDCKRGSQPPQRFLTIESYTELTSRKERQDWLSTKGPVVACMAIYRDFFAYKNGIYRHKTGDLAGYHAICCIGYNKKDEYWICKNSWDKTWGDQGFFKIGFGEAMIDTDFAMYGVSGIDGNIINEENGEDLGKGIAEQIVVERESSNGRNILWTFVAGQWRYLILSDIQAGAIAPTLLASQQVMIYYQNKKIIRYQASKN